jgi:hypothetical protein
MAAITQDELVNSVNYGSCGQHNIIGSTKCENYSKDIAIVVK